MQQTLGHDTFTRATETYVVVSITARSERTVNKHFKGVDIDWSEIEDQLAKWSNHLKDLNKADMNT